MEKGYEKVRRELHERLEKCIDVIEGRPINVIAHSSIVIKPYARGESGICAFSVQVDFVVQEQWTKDTTHETEKTEVT